MDTDELKAWILDEVRDVLRIAYLESAKALDIAASEARRAHAQAALTGAYAHSPEWFKGYEDACRAAAESMRIRAVQARDMPQKADVVQLHKGGNH